MVYGSHAIIQTRHSYYNITLSNHEKKSSFLSKMVYLHIDDDPEKMSYGSEELDTGKK